MALCPDGRSHVLWLVWSKCPRMSKVKYLSLLGEGATETRLASHHGIRAIPWNRLMPSAEDHREVPCSSKRPTPFPKVVASFLSPISAAGLNLVFRKPRHLFEIAYDSPERRVLPLLAHQRAFHSQMSDCAPPHCRDSSIPKRWFFNERMRNDNGKIILMTGNKR